LYDCLSDVFNQPKPKFRIPKPVIYTGAVVLGPISPIQPSYVQAVINRYSWYTANRAEQELGYTSRPLLATIQSVKIEIQKRILGTFFIEDRKTSAPVVAHNPDEKLLITGFPGWFCNRIIDIFINGDNDGLNKTNRKVRLLVQPHLLNLVPTLPSNFEVFVGDVTDKESLLHATRGVTAVWHAAGVIYPKHIDLFEKVNAQGTRNVADACVANGVRRMMYMSTDSTCGYSPEGTVFSATEAPNPYKTYGKSKYAGEQYITQLTAEGKLDATTFRGFWFFGPNIPMRNLAFFQAFTWPFVPVFGNGRNLRSISHCDDMLNAFVKAEHAPATYGKWYWLPAFVQAQTVDQIYSMVAKGLQSKAMLLHIPNFICNICDSVDSYLTNKKQILNPTIHAAGKFHKTIATDAAGIAPAKADFGWEPKVTALQIQQEIRDSLASN
jgi:nucleoside-diphosphate-sugar epimerase